MFSPRITIRSMSGDDDVADDTSISPPATSAIATLRCPGLATAESPYDLFERLGLAMAQYGCALELAREDTGWWRS
ncbi:hypothetical protein [Chitinimonas naiadis]